MFNIIKFLSGFNIFNGEKRGKLIFYGVLIVLALTIYHKAFEPKQTTVIERIETQVINQCPKEKTIEGKLKIGFIKLNISLF